ncbi:patatin-like phospholipase family protein [Candidatus Woesearchaeota archaeon]|nr:patatin-like phospholipase family protein [Candidatus Woesearchaeota archaeon]
MAKKLGLALGAGAARGMAHIGVLKAFDEAGIKVDAISGSSIGAVVGALYACGYSAKQIEELALSTEWKSLIDFTAPKTGFIAGRKVENYLRNLLKCKNFEDLKTDFYVIATEVNKGERVVITKGDIARAARASISISGVLSPVKCDDMLLVDGGFIDPVPVDVLREKNIHKIIAVDLSFNLKSMYSKKKIKPEKKFQEVFKDMFITSQVEFLRDFIFKGKVRVPKVLKWFIKKTDPEKLIKRITKILTGKDLPQFVKIYAMSVGITMNELSKTKILISKVDIILNPGYGNVDWDDFYKTKEAIELGYNVAKRHMKEIKKLYKK